MAHVFSILQSVLEADKSLKLFSILSLCEGAVRLLCSSSFLKFSNSARKQSRLCPSFQVAADLTFAQPSHALIPLLMTDMCGHWSRCVVSAIGVLKHDLKENV